jgi:hypothetical protein
MTCTGRPARELNVVRSASCRRTTAAKIRPSSGAEIAPLRRTAVGML